MTRRLVNALDVHDEQRGVRVRECRHGLFCYFPHDLFIGRALDRYGEYSEGEVQLFERLLKPGHVVIEVGSNIGTLTVPISRLVQTHGRVFAFEPQRIIFQQLCANLAMNGIFNTWAEQKAVGTYDLSKGEIPQIGVPLINYAEPHNFGGVSLVKESPEMVRLVRLDDYPYNQIFPHFIKLDCEGMELDVLEGASKMIERARPAMYVENDRPEKAAALLQALWDRKYTLYWHVTSLYNKDNYRGDDKNDIYSDGVGIMCSANMLCFPSELKIEVQGLPKITSVDDVWTQGVVKQPEMVQ